MPYPTIVLYKINTRRVDYRSLGVKEFGSLGVKELRSLGVWTIALVLFVYTHVALRLYTIWKHIITI